MKYSLIVDVPDDADPGAVQGALLNGAIQFAEHNDFRATEVDEQISGQFVVVKLSGHRTPFDWSVQRIE